MYHSSTAAEPKIFVPANAILVVNNKKIIPNFC
jgi:hypothetical protein